MTQFSRARTCLSLLFKLIVIVSAVTGTIMSAAGDRNAFMGNSTVFMYFTIQSNIAVALLSLAGAVWMLSGKPVTRAAQVIKLVGAVSITLTGVVFCFVLVPVLGGNAWNIQNVLTHVVVPVVSVLDLFVTGSCYPYRKRDIPWVIVPPLLYAVYAGIGYAAKWEFAPGTHYPYFFLNWGSPAGAFGFSDELPFMGCMWWILLLLLFLLAVSAVYLLLLRLFRPHGTKKAA